MSSGAPVLRSMAAEDIDKVVSVAVRDASPIDVMPPDADPDPMSWTLARDRRYAEFLRSRLERFPDGRSETSFLVAVDDRILGIG